MNYQIDPLKKTIYVDYDCFEFKSYKVKSGIIETIQFKEEFAKDPELIKALKAIGVKTIELYNFEERIF